MAVACLTLFLKGLIDFERMGKKSRDLLEDLLHRWHSKEIQETSTKVPQLEKALYKALKVIPADLSENKCKKALARLEKALLDFGVPPERAKERAATIAQSVAEFVATRNKR